MTDEPMTHAEMVEHFQRNVVPVVTSFAAKIEEILQEGTSVEEYVERWDTLWGKRHEIRENMATISQALNEMFAIKGVDEELRAHSILTIGPAIQETMETVARYLQAISKERAPTQPQRVEGLLRRIDRKLDRLDRRIDSIESDLLDVKGSV